MATTKIWAIRSDLSASISYVVDSKKTENLRSAIDYVTKEEKVWADQFCSGINCDVESALVEFQLVKKQFSKEGGILAHHAVQSFMPGEVDAEKAHEIGVKLANKMWGERFQVIVTTHLDKKHIHNHFIINSVSFRDGKKYNGCRESYRQLQQLSDEYCKSAGLSVIGLALNESYEDLRYEKRRFHLREYIRNDIDLAVSKSISMEEFYANLKRAGYQIKFGKHIAVSIDGKRFVRLRSLKDEAYQIDGIRKRIAENYSRNFAAPIIRKSRKRKRCKKSHFKLSGYMALYYRYLFMLGKKVNKRYPKRIPYHIAKEVSSLDDISREIRLIKKRGIENTNDLARVRKSIEQEYKSFEKKREQKRKEVRRVVPENEKAHQKKEIMELTRKLKVLREDMKACERIAARTLNESGKKEVCALKTYVDNEKGVRANEHRERDRGSAR